MPSQIDTEQEDNSLTLFPVETPVPGKSIPNEAPLQDGFTLEKFFPVEKLLAEKILPVNAPQQDGLTAEKILCSLDLPEDFEADEEQDIPFWEEEYFLTEEDFFHKKVNKKFLERGFKRPVSGIRSETRRPYRNFRETKREEKRFSEKFVHINTIGYLARTPDPGTNNTAVNSRTGATQNSSITSNPTSASTANPTNPTPANSAASNPPPKAARYLTADSEREYQEELKRAETAPATGISVQQLLEMLNRDLTPEDYELLLRLDETVQKKTVKQETLTTLTEKSIDSEAHCSEICTICMCNYEMGDNVKYLPCNHFFHTGCIVPYLSNYGQACPVCKTKIQPD